MRLNQFLAKNTDLSRRGADQAISSGRVSINGKPAELGSTVDISDTVTLDGKIVSNDQETATIMLHKPVGYVVSRDGQGSPTIYDLLPSNLHNLNPVGRLDKDSSGLLLLTNDGQLANRLTHPRYEKEKIYQVELDKPLSELDKSRLRQGVDIGDTRPSALEVRDMRLEFGYRTKTENCYEVHISEGRNRQIRRTFEALGYKVIKLHRTNFGDYSLDELKSGQYSVTI